MSAMGGGMILIALATLTAVPSPALMPLGHTQHVGRFVVTPIKVEEDSRCPMNARCVWAGRVVVRARVIDGRRRAMRRFTLGEPAGGLVLDSVTPARMAGARGGQIRYRVHFSPAL